MMVDNQRIQTASLVISSILTGWRSGVPYSSVRAAAWSTVLRVTCRRIPTTSAVGRIQRSNLLPAPSTWFCTHAQRTCRGRPVWVEDRWIQRMFTVLRRRLFFFILFYSEVKVWKTSIALLWTKKSRSFWSLLSSHCFIYTLQRVC